MLFKAILQFLKHLNSRLAVRPFTGDGRDISPVEKVDNIHQSQRLKTSNTCQTQRWQNGEILFVREVGIWGMIVIIEIWSMNFADFETYMYFPDFSLHKNHYHVFTFAFYILVLICVHTGTLEEEKYLIAPIMQRIW